MLFPAAPRVEVFVLVLPVRRQGFQERGGHSCVEKVVNTSPTSSGNASQELGSTRNQCIEIFLFCHVCNKLRVARVFETVSSDVFERSSLACLRH